MRKKTNNQYLNVYLQNIFVGKLSSISGSLSFSYDEDYLRRSDARKISSSMPLQTEEFSHQVASPFFSGLLPDGIIRTRIAKYLGLSENNIFALLKEIGGDCAGAISLFPESIFSTLKQERTYRVLNNNEALEILSMLEKRPLMVGEEDIRISGAGAQDKLMISLVEGKIAIPTGITPSTHIIKTNISGLEETVQNEFFCMKLARKLGLPVPEVWIYRINKTPFYLIERYDRKIDSDGNVKRLHQEDFCQAMHVPPELKYEKEGGPSLKDCFDFLDTKIKVGAMAGRSKLTLLQCIIFNYLIGNGDAHGKNFSILYDSSQESLAPFYDLMSTVVYSNLHKSKMAMKIDKKYRFRDVSVRHFKDLGESVGFRRDFVKKQILMISKNIVLEGNILSAALTSSEENYSPIYTDIMNVIRSHAKIV